MTRPVPTYDLYGEDYDTSAAQSPEFLLHCEEIHERSRVHGWEIRPHRHAHYFQILHIVSGRAEVSDGLRFLTLRLPAIVIVPAGVPHGFRFSHDVDGFVLTLAVARLTTLIGTELKALTAGKTVTTQHLGESEIHRQIGKLLARIPGEYTGRAPAHAAMVEALAVASLVQLVREWPREPSAADDGTDLQRQRRLDELIETHYREHRDAGFYAGFLGISTTHLNRLVKARRGTTVQGLLTSRLVDEAKRGLIFSAQPIKTLALNLGFSDTAYFTRFFRRETGTRPSDYRRRHQDRQPH